MQCNFSFHSLCICETWATPDTDKSYILSDYEPFPLSREKTQHGGLTIYIRNDFEASELINLRSYPIYEHLFQYVFLEIYEKEKPENKYIVGYVYRPPFKDIRLEIFLRHFRETLLNIPQNNTPLIIAGDFNIDFYDLDDNHLYNEFFDMTLSQGLIPRTYLPTRICNTRASLLDQIFTKLGPNYNIENGIIESNF